MFNTKFTSSGGSFDSNLTAQEIIKGEDGFSPIVTIEDFDGAHNISITDKNGTQTTTIFDGYTPIKGEDYFTETEIKNIEEEIAGEIKQEVQEDIDSIEKQLSDIDDEMEEIEAIAKGAVGGKSFMSYQELVEELNVASATDYAKAQHLLVRTLGVPDLWIYEVNEESVPYEYTTDEAIAEAVKEGTLQVGYYVLSALETQKVDLTDYVKNTDYASTNEAGIVKLNSTEYGLTLSAKGLLGINRATEINIDKRQTQRPITPAVLEYAIKSGLTTNTIALTDEEKEKALTWLGVIDKIGDVETVLDSIITIQESLIGGVVE